MSSFSDYLNTPLNGFLTVVASAWVRLVNNTTSTAYVSTAISDPNTGEFTFTGVPPGSYTVYTGPSNTGPWTATGDANYIVPLAPQTGAATSGVFVDSNGNIAVGSITIQSGSGPFTVTAPGGGIAIGSGDLLGLAGTSATTPMFGDIRSGTAASPDTTARPLIKVSRSQQLTAASITGDGVSQVSGIISEVAAIGTTAQVQAIAIAGIAETASTDSHAADATGIYGVGNVLSGGTHKGIAIFGNGKLASGANVAGGASANAFQGNVRNDSGTDLTVAANGFSGGAIFVWTNGTNLGGCAFEVGTDSAGSGQQYDVGVHFNGASSGATFGGVKTASYQDDSHAATSILINGTHATAAMAVAASSGSVLIGETALMNSGALLEVKAPTANTNPLVYFGNTGDTHAYRVKLGNQTGIGGWFVSGGTNNVLTGTIAGDLGMTVDSVGTFFHLGGTISTVKVSQDNKLGFFNVTAVAQPSAVGAATGYTTGTTAATFHSDDTYSGNTGTTSYTINGLVAALKNLGLIHT